MKSRFNLFLVNGLIVTFAIAFSTCLFLAQMYGAAHQLAQKEQEEALRTFWQILKRRGADFRIVDGRLLAGDYVINGDYEIPDRIREIFGGTATIFMGDTRVSTNVLLADGSRAVGTRLTGPAYDAIFRKNRPYRGEAPILGVPYLTAYDPIRDSNGKTIGVLYVGVKKSDFQATYDRMQFNVIAGAVAIEVLFLAIAFVLFRERNLYAGLHRESESRIREVAQVLSETTGETFFSSLVENLARLLQAEFAFIGELCGNNKDTIRVIASFAHGKPADIFEYSLAGTPCAEVVKGSFCFHPEGVARHYPEARLLAEMNAEGFLGIPLTLADGTIVGIMAVIDSNPLAKRHDTEPIFRLFAVRAAAELSRRKKELRLREMAGQIRLIIDSVPVGIAYLDADRRMKFANRRYEELFCHAGTDIVGGDVREIVGETFFTAIEDTVQLAMSGKESSCLNRLNRGEGGSTYLQTTCIPHGNEQGDVIGYFIQHYDVTERKIAEEILAEKEEFLSCIIDGIQDGISILDAELRIIRANPVTERRFSDMMPLVGRKCYEVYHGRTTPCEPCPSLETLRSGKPARRTFSRVENDAEVWLELNIYPLFDAKKSRITGVIEYIRDVTARKRAEDELQAAEQKFRSLVELSLVGIYIIQDGKFVYVNPKMAEIFGYGRDELASGINHLDLTLEKDRPLAAENVRKRLAGELQSVQYEFKGVRKDGTAIDIEVYGTSIRYQGKAAILGTLLDITERKEMADALRNQLDFLQTLIDTIPSPIFYKDRAGRYLGCNRAFGEYLGLAKEELVGKSVFDIAPRELADRYFEMDEALLGRPGVQKYESSVRYADGTLHDVIFHKATFAAKDGTVGGLVGVILDVSERKRAEAALRESEDRFHQIFAQNWDAVILFRLDNLAIIDANPAALRLYGMSIEEMTDLTPRSLFEAEDFRKLIDMVPGDAHSRSFQMDMGVALRENGTGITVSVRAKVISLRKEYVVYCSIRDITERVRMEEEIRNTQAKLIHANKMTSLGMLASSIAHEINNPNNCIAVNAVMLADAWQDATPILKRQLAGDGDFPLGGLPFSELEELAPRLFAGITEGSRRINAIITNMKDYVRPDRGNLRVEFDLNRAVQDAATILWHHIHKYSDNFMLSLEDGLPPVRGSRQQIEQVVINLITNALQALPDKGAAVSVATLLDQPAGLVLVTIRDTGKGMDENVLRKITEPFFTTRSTEGGTGLGLYISASIVKEHKGSLEFDSAPGRGTTVTVRLPAAEAHHG